MGAQQGKSIDEMVGAPHQVVHGSNGGASRLQERGGRGERGEGARSQRAQHFGGSGAEAVQLAAAGHARG